MTETDKTEADKRADEKVVGEKVIGTVGSPNPKTGSADAARGLGGHSKDASHEKGAPAGYVEDGKPKSA